MALAAALSLLVLPDPSARAAETAVDSPVLEEGREALAEAKASGSRVEVVGERTERETVFANPDGFTLTAEQSIVPVRVARAGGGWQTPDPALERRADGSIGPKAAAVDMTFSGGGDGPLVEIVEQGLSLELEWLNSLPTPQIDGPSAVYVDVLPDVDLKVTATTESFQQVLVVKTPAAAADPNLAKLTFGLRTKGLTVRKGAAGNLAAVDANGQTVFRSPPAQMWDSAGSAPAEQPTILRSTTAESNAARAEVSGARSETSGSSLEPGHGDNVTRIDVQVTKDTLAVIPDAGMLATTNGEAFPLFIDPTVTWGESERTLLRSDGYESYGWGNDDDGRGKGVGKCGTWSGYYCGPGYVQRLYFEFSPANLKGKDILSATFRVTEPWAFQCDPRWVDLVRTNNISSSTTWSSRPANLDLMVDRNVSAGRGSSCDKDSPDAPIEFKDNAEETNENLTPTVRSFAAGNFSRLTLMLKAHDEGDTSAWKRFKNDAVLAVNYVGLPALPRDVGLVSGSSTKPLCSTNSALPDVVSDPTPLVTGIPLTASGGSAGANLRIRWRTDKLTGTTWSTAHTDLDGPTSGYVSNLVKQSRSLPTLAEGTLYRLKALTLSYYEDGSHRLNTGYTTPCYFRVDPTAPKAPKITFVSTYTQCTPTVCEAGGGPGIAGSFTFASAAGDSNVAYQYRLSNDAAWSAEMAGATVPATITPQRPGTYQLYVRGKDSVGRWGAQNVVDFLVRAGSDPVGLWHLDEASGVAVDSATADGADDATLATGATRDARGRRGLITHDSSGDPLATPVEDRGLALNGSSGYAATGASVLETRSAYTVSAWARIDRTDVPGVVLAQDGSQSSPFVLSYSSSSGRWFFGVKDTDSATGVHVGVSGKGPVVPRAWTHLAGTYDPVKKEVALYVNGVSQGTATASGAWASTGAFQIGRYKSSGTYQQNFPGSIDEVAVWQRALLPDQIAEEARLLISGRYAGLELVADWSADLGSGTTVPDTSSGYSKTLTLSGGASLQDGDIVLDGIDDSATVSGPIVDDTGSFTVTTLVSLDESKLAAQPVGYVGQVLGQRTADGSAWGLWFQITGHRTVLDEETMEERTVPVGFWHFGRLNTDGTFSSVASASEVVMDGAVRLTGIFDAQDGQGTIALRTGYVLNGEPKVFTAKAGTGDFAIGKAFASGTWRHFLPARVSEVRAWAGAIASQEQAEIVTGD
ncbi:LamG-like jellyroll fold domain-containing protein [Streptomyces sp. NPDC006978]|uniref:LamG-like jellyroll fold domain-containing protein n=1 Tax=Streptomyces sp. NPDC006978 TaxID=3364769 RepID=UPI0036A531D9